MLLAEVLEWQNRSVCAANPEPWVDPDTADLAIHMCLRHCPVLAQCREWAGRRDDWDSVVVAGVAWAARSNGGPGRPLVLQNERLCQDCIGRGCLECGSPIEGRSAQAKTCSTDCARKRANRSHRAYEQRRPPRRRCAVCRTSLPPGWPDRRPFCKRERCREVWQARQSRATTTRARERSRTELEVAA